MQYPRAGPPIARELLERFDAEVDGWPARVAEAEDAAVQLEMRVQRHTKGARREEDLTEQARQAREEADRLASAPSPRPFAECMNKSRLFFHTDKRKDSALSAEQLAAQFSQASDAWECLDACRTHFCLLRGFRAKAQVAAEAAGKESGSDVDDWHDHSHVALSSTATSSLPLPSAAWDLSVRRNGAIK